MTGFIKKSFWRKKDSSLKSQCVLVHVVSVAVFVQDPSSQLLGFPLLMPWFLMDINSTQARRRPLPSLDKQSTHTSKRWKKKKWPGKARSLCQLHSVDWGFSLIFESINLNLSKVTWISRTVTSRSSLHVRHFSYFSFPFKMAGVLLLASLFSPVCISWTL